MSRILKIKLCTECFDRELNRETKNVNRHYIEVENSEDCFNCRKNSSCKYNNKTRWGSERYTLMQLTFFSVTFGLALLILCYALYEYVLPSGENKINMENCVTTLKQKYTNQKQALWSYVYKMLNDSTSPIHSLILLHKDNGDTAVKFARDLISMINKKDNGAVLEYEAGKWIDYGDELVHYLKEVKKNKNLIVPKLEEVPVGSVTMFHVLCDESMSQYKPLYFIFTLKDTSDMNSNSIKNQNSLKKASHILRNTWRSLPGNELHPLISRIARNVVEILPENINL